jgi:hypothetical protein
MLDRIAAQIRSGQKIIFAQVTDRCEPPKLVAAMGCFDARATASFRNYRATFQLACAAVRDSESQKSNRYTVQPQRFQQSHQRL